MSTATATEANTWFQDSIEYAGRATAQFATPKGVVTGLARVQATPYGEFEGTMECRELTTEGVLPFGWIQFFENGGPTPDADGVQAMALHTGWNTCVGFQVETPAGVFRAEAPIHFNYTVGTSGTKLQFHFQRSEFAPVSPLPATYWVLPLCNFINRFFPTPPPLSVHPLRIWVEHPVQAGGVSEDHRKLLRWSKDRVIPFFWNGAPAFIERLPTYDERMKELEEGDQPTAMTAVMVGEVGDDPPTIPLDEWRVLWLLPVLALACGNDVRAAWIELRAVDGQLVKRIHFRSATARFRDNDNVVTGGVGALLTGGQFSSHFGEPHLRACIRHLNHSSGDGSPLEDRLDHLGRALELLCRLHGFNSNSAYSADLPASGQERLNEVRSAVDAIAKRLIDPGLLAGMSTEEQDSLQQVSRRLNAAFTLPVGFGKAVVALTRHYGLMDSAAVAPHFRRAAGGLPRRWDQALSRHRNTVIHHGYFDVADVLEVYKFIEHLRDVLTRILLKMVCYVGKYVVGMAKYSGTEKWVGWVTSETDPAQLGYRDDQ